MPFTATKDQVADEQQMTRVLVRGRLRHDCEQHLARRAALHRDEQRLLRRVFACMGHDYGAEYISGGVEARP